MDYIANCIISSIDDKIDENLNFQSMQNGEEMDMSIDEMHDILISIIDLNMIDGKISLYYENYGYQRKTVISLVYSGRLCEIGEHYDTQRDYFFLRIHPKKL